MDEVLVGNWHALQGFSVTNTDKQASVVLNIIRLSSAPFPFPSLYSFCDCYNMFNWQNISKIFRLLSENYFCVVSEDHLCRKKRCTFQAKFLILSWFTTSKTLHNDWKF